MTIVIDGTTGISGVDGTASNPSYEGTDSNTGIFFPAADTVAIGTGGTEALRVNSSQNVGIGTSSPSYKLQVQLPSSGIGAAFRYTGGTNNPGLFFSTNESTTVSTIDASASTSGILALNTSGTERMRIDSSGNVGIGTSSPNARLSLGTNVGTVGQPNQLVLYDDATLANRIGFGISSGLLNIVAGTSTSIAFYTNGANERARILSGGTFLVGKATDTFSVAGVQIAADGDLGVTKSGTPFSVNRISSDGVLVAFYQDTILEGNISVSGTTVSYNGGHLARWSQLLNGQRDESIVKGTVLSNLDEMCEWLDAEGNPLPNEQLNRMKVSDVEGDTNVAGVFVNWDNDDQDNLYDMNIAMTGDMIIRIAQGVTVQKGDLLMSAGDGTAKPQGDDIVRSKTVAKVTSNHVTCIYDDGSYCVPCVLMAC